MEQYLLRQYVEKPENLNPEDYFKLPTISLSEIKPLFKLSTISGTDIVSDEYYANKEGDEFFDLVIKDLYAHTYVGEVKTKTVRTRTRLYESGLDGESRVYETYYQ